jgi:hypothetical protein
MVEPLVVGLVGALSPGWRPELSVHMGGVIQVMFLVLSRPEWHMPPPFGLPSLSDVVEVGKQARGIRD